MYLYTYICTLLCDSRLFLCVSLTLFVCRGCYNLMAHITTLTHALAWEEKTVEVAHADINSNVVGSS